MSDTEEVRIPRRAPLRRANTDTEFDTRRFNKKLEKIRSNSDQLSRRRHPQKRAERLLQDLKDIPRPRSPSLSQAYVETLEAIAEKTRGCEKAVQQLSERPDIRPAIHQALADSSIQPLLRWPEKLWHRSAFKRLVFDKHGQPRDSGLEVQLLAHWLAEQSPDTYLREDGGARRMFKYLVEELDPWKPASKINLFVQCALHCNQLPPRLLQILKQLRRCVPELSGSLLFSQLMLGSYLPRALERGFTEADIKEAMRSVVAPPERSRWILDSIWRQFD